MADIKFNPQVTINVTFTITESEARALNCLVLYGVDNFINVFYNNLGKSDLSRHENGLRSFLDSVKNNMPKALLNLDRTKKVLSEAKSGIVNFDESNGGSGEEQ